MHVPQITSGKSIKMEEEKGTLLVVETDGSVDRSATAQQCKMLVEALNDCSCHGYAVSAVLRSLPGKCSLIGTV